MSLPSFKLLRPRTLEDAVRFLRRFGGELQIVAGGTDLIPSLRQRLFAPAYVMDIRGISELEGIRARAGEGVDPTQPVTFREHGGALWFKGKGPERHANDPARRGEPAGGAD